MDGSLGVLCVLTLLLRRTVERGHTIGGKARGRQRSQGVKKQQHKAAKLEDELLKEAASLEEEHQIISDFLGSFPSDEVLEWDLGDFRVVDQGQAQVTELDAVDDDDMCASQGGVLCSQEVFPTFSARLTLWKAREAGGSFASAERKRWADLMEFDDTGRRRRARPGPRRRRRL